MKTIFITALLVLTALACSFNLSTANITEAKMAKDPDGNQPATSFTPDEAFYCVVTLAHAPDDTSVKSVWTAVEVAGVEPNLSLGEQEITAGDGLLNFSYTTDPGKVWPVGQYKVDLYLNDKLDRTLAFQVEVAAVAEQPSPTLEPTATPEPEPTAEPTEEPAPTPQPTATPEPELTQEPTEESVTSDILVIARLTPEPTAAPAQAEPLPFKEEPYRHPSGAFTLALPESFEGIASDKNSVTFGDEQSAVSVVFVNPGVVYAEEQMQHFIDEAVKIVMPTYADEYTVLEQTPQPDDRIYVSVAFELSTYGDGYADFFFEQRDTVVFVLNFVSVAYNDMLPTWNAIIDSYSVDPKAAAQALPPQVAQPTPQPQPTPPPAPPVNPFAPQPGRSRLYVFNEIAETLTFTINNQEYKIPPDGIDHPVPIDLDPGKYTYTISIPGAAVNGEVELGPNQSWAMGVRGDKAVYNPYQVYP